MGSNSSVKKLPTFPSGEGGSPQARRKRGVTGESGTYFPTALAHYPPPQSGLRPASSPVGEAFNLPLRGRWLAAGETDEGRYGREWYVFPHRSRPLHPSSVSLTRASTTFYGIAATGSYVRFNSLRDAPPAGEALSPTFPSGEGGPPQRWMRGVAGVSGTYFPTAPAHYAPPQSR